MESIICINVHQPATQPSYKEDLLLFSCSYILNCSFLSLCYFLFPLEAKKSCSTGRQLKEAVPEETNQSVFGEFVREAGVTLKNDGTSNEIGKPTFQQHIYLENKVRFSLILSLQAVDQVVFQKRIQQQLQKSPRYPGVSISLSLNPELHADVRAFFVCDVACT